MMAMVSRAKMVEADSAPAAEASGEYQAYRLPNAGSLPRGSVQRLPLVDPTTNIGFERRYETRFSTGDWIPPHPIIDANYGAMDGQQQPVSATLRFRNGKAAGLVPPLTTPLQSVIDLSATRTREEFTVDRDGRTMVERISVVLKNAKDSAVTVRVTESLPRWSEWDITASSIAPLKRNAQSVEFDVPVPAGGEVTLGYTVRYRWAPDVKIP